MIFKDGTADEVTYYYVLNLQGDVEKIIDANGVVQAIYSYDPWGKILSITSGTGASVNDTHIAKLNGLRYRGYHGDNETQWYYLQSRYYDPFTRRFVNADALTSTGQGILGVNMFAYCLNNPVEYVDEAGYYAMVGDLGEGWYYRIDPENTSTKTQRHVHIWNNKSSYAQNADSSPHDKNNNSSGPLPKKVQERLLKKTGWDYNGNRKNFYKQTSFSCGDSGLIIDYVDGTRVYKYPTIISGFAFPTPTRINDLGELEEIYFSTQRTTSKSLPTNSIFVLPIITSTPLPSFSFYPAYIPAPLFFKNCTVGETSHEVFHKRTLGTIQF